MGDCFQHREAEYQALSACLQDLLPMMKMMLSELLKGSNFASIPNLSVFGIQSFVDTLMHQSTFCEPRITLVALSLSTNLISSGLVQNTLASSETTFEM
jgi:hypothetical protein